MQCHYLLRTETGILRGKIHNWSWSGLVSVKSWLPSSQQTSRSGKDELRLEKKDNKDDDGEDGHKNSFLSGLCSQHPG